MNDDPRDLALSARINGQFPLSATLWVQKSEFATYKLSSLSVGAYVCGKLMLPGAAINWVK
jgi:hypothetical protein